MKQIVTIFCLLLLLSPQLESRAQAVETFAKSPLIVDYLTRDQATGDIYVSSYTKVSRIAPDGSIKVLAEDLPFVTGLALSAAGDLYCVSSNSGTIFKIAPDGTMSEFVTELNRPVGIIYDATDDALYVQTFAEPGEILQITLDGTVTTVATGIGEGGTDLAMDDEGNFYVASFNAGTIKKVTPDGTVSDFATLPSWIGYITYGGGHIYATAWQLHQIYKFTTEGEQTLVAGTGTQGLLDGDSIEKAEFSEPNGIVASADGDTLYVSDYSTNALRIISGATTVDVERLEDEVPADYLLHQNYPNPFNPTTTLSYSLPDAAEVTLKVFDMLGTEVASLVNEQQAPGTYQAMFDAHNLASGVYYYQLRAGTVVETRKMVLLK